MSASFGPALTKSFASIARRNIVPSTASPVTTCHEKFGITFLLGFLSETRLPLANLSGFGISLAGNLVPCAHVGDSSLVARHHNFSSLCDRQSIFAARATTAPCADLLKDDFASAPSADRAAHSSEDSGHLIFSGIDSNIMFHQHAREEPSHDGSANQTCKGRQQEREP